MSYHYEKNGDLVIDSFEKGIADSPFNGLGNIQNLNVSYIDGISYVNYKRQACTITGGTLGIPLYATQSPQGTIYISDDNFQIFKQTAPNSSTFDLLTGRTFTTDQIRGIQFWSNFLVVFCDNQRIEICGDGFGDSTINSSNWNTAAGTGGVWPIKGAAITITGLPAAGDTSATIQSYTDAQGNNRAFWNGPTGTYFIVFSTSSGTQTVVASLIQGVAAFSFTPALNSAATSTTVAEQAFDVSNTTSSIGAGTRMSLVSVNDGNLYFCNGAYVGSFQAVPFQTVAKGNMKTFRYNCASLGLPRTDGSIWLTEMRNQLLVAAFHKIYPWDRISPQWSNPIPVYENISKMTNILNTVFILAGNKGNIYYSNGYNCELFYKIPDTITGVVDPRWTYGGIMEHRNQLLFEATATNSSTAANIVSGVYRLDIDTKAFSMDSQHSGGLVPTGLSLTGGVLVNNSNLTPLPYDNYYSGYGATANSMDFNDTTLWSSNEGLLETDIIPIGTAVQPKTFASAEFKLDQPMQSGDSISLYARQSLSDSYVLIGTTTTSVLSEFYQSVPFQEWQWVQFRITFSCNPAVGSSSRMRLREIRIR